MPDQPDDPENSPNHSTQRSDANGDEYAIAEAIFGQTTEYDSILLTTTEISESCGQSKPEVEAALESVSWASPVSDQRSVWKFPPRVMKCQTVEQYVNSNKHYSMEDFRL